MPFPFIAYALLIHIIRSAACCQDRLSAIIWNRSDYDTRKQSIQNCLFPIGWRSIHYMGKYVLKPWRTAGVLKSFTSAHRMTNLVLLR
ncbi:hypothetical protein CBFG_01731 [Clostridiales bacterium 1_7_47FAA]|nr:hypothetical protein CBFG_01731 [Clostridiales bacterium 1_7_47FAA]